MTTLPSTLHFRLLRCKDDAYVSADCSVVADVCVAVLRCELLLYVKVVFAQRWLVNRAVAALVSVVRFSEERVTVVAATHTIRLNHKSSTTTGLVSSLIRALRLCSFRVTPAMVAGNDFIAAQNRSFLHV